MQPGGSLCVGTGAKPASGVGRHTTLPQDVVALDIYPRVALPWTGAMPYAVGSHDPAGPDMTQHDTDMTHPPRVTVEDAAQLLGVSVDAVRKRIERGTLRSERVGKARYVLLDETAMTDHDTARTRHDSPDRRAPFPQCLPP